MEELIGQTLNRYKILQLLGEGGMGGVFKAHDVTLQRDVAIKLMHPHLSRRKDFQTRFLQEARTAARLDHPSIVEVHDFGQHKNMLYIVMEFIPGDNLRKLLDKLRDKEKWIPLPESVQLLRQVASAAHYAHKNGVLHRDLKPANIMLKPEPADGLPFRPVLTDLGLAKLMEGMPITQEGTSMGTPPYMSPEQALGEDTDARSDVYSLGIILYELAVGKLPFPIQSLSDAIRYHTKEPPPPPRQLHPELPQALEAVILQAIAKDPSDRFQDAEQLALALESALTAATQVVSAPPTAGAGAASLFTQFQASLLQPRGPSLVADFGAPPSDLSQDRVQVLSQDKTTRSVAFKTGGLTIGRADDNDIAIDDTKASRNHARIDFDGQSYRVVDLDSTNGTLLGNNKLLPGVPELWDPAVALRIGDTWLRLLRADQPAAGQLTRSDGTRLDASMVHTSSGEARIGIFLETPQLAVEPGGAVTATLMLLNQSALVDHFSVSVAGVPNNWLPAPPQPVQLMPGSQQPLTLVLQPPRSPQAKAGRYPLTFQVASQDAPGQVAEVKGALTVGAFSQFKSELRPQKVRAGRTACLSVTNQGNAQENFALAFQDRADELLFDPPQSQLIVQPGTSAEAEFTAKARQRRWIGGAKSHSVSATVTSPKGDVQSLMGEVISKALIPTWLPPLLIILCLLTVSGAYLFYGQLTNQASDATATAVANVTAIAELALSADTDNDGITDVQELDLGTDPGNPDTDGDGLSDKVEIEGVTNPLSADTDGDGLSDGEEETRFGTDPNNRDSDGDTLPDGTEVNETGTSPTNPDTDGDGLNDNVDPAAGPPTPTPTHTATPTPSPSPTSPPTGTPTEIPTNTPTTEPPHAPPIDNTFGTQLFDEQVQLLTIQSGGSLVLPVMEIWSAPVGTPVSCATGFLAFTWQVRDPFPTGGEGLEFQQPIPMGGGRTEVIGEGMTGSASIGWCSELTVFNPSLNVIRVEIRYASGSFE